MKAARKGEIVAKARKDISRLATRLKLKFGQEKLNRGQRSLVLQPESHQSASLAAPLYAPETYRYASSLVSLTEGAIDRYVTGGAACVTGEATAGMPVRFGFGAVGQDS